MGNQPRFPLTALNKEAKAARALGLYTPALAPASLHGIVSGIEVALNDVAANSRVVAAAYAKFMDPGLGIKFVEYPGTLLTDHEMAVVMFAAAAVNPGMPITGLLHVEALESLYGVGGDTGRTQYLKAAVKGLGVYYYDASTRFNFFFTLYYNLSIRDTFQASFGLRTFPWSII